jgi:hypothetical protein
MRLLPKTTLPTVLSSESADQHGIAIAFRAPASLARLIDQAAGRQMLSISEYCRRVIQRSVERMEVNHDN